MNPALEKRLRRLSADRLRAEDEAVGRRCMLRARVAVGDKLRRMLAERGVDVSGIAMLRVVDEAAAELATLPSGAAAEAAEAAWFARQPAGRPRESYAYRLVRMALLHFSDGRRPDPKHASLAQWHAWCLVTPASPHEPPILADPEVQRYRRMLRLGSGDPAWRLPPGAEGVAAAGDKAQAGGMSS